MALPMDVWMSCLAKASSGMDVWGGMFNVQGRRQDLLEEGRDADRQVLAALDKGRLQALGIMTSVCFSLPPIIIINIIIIVIALIVEFSVQVRVENFNSVVGLVCAAATSTEREKRDGSFCCYYLYCAGRTGISRCRSAARK